MKTLDDGGASGRRGDTPHLSQAEQDQLVTANLGMVRVIARNDFHKPNDPAVSHDDLVAAGMLGLVAAARTYDPSRGAFDDYARTIIKTKLVDVLREATKRNPADDPNAYRADAKRRKAESYTVKHGDTFASIAAGLGNELLEFDLAELNPRVDPDRPTVGQKIRLPGPRAEKLLTMRRLNDDRLANGGRTTLDVVSEREDAERGEVRPVDPRSVLLSAIMDPTERRAAELRHVDGWEWADIAKELRAEIGGIGWPALRKRVETRIDTVRRMAPDSVHPPVLSEGEHTADPT